MSKNKESVSSTSSGTHNVLASGTALKGNISASEDFRIDGTIEGEVKCQGKIIIGQNGSITGEIECVNIEIFGAFKGNITCSETIILRATSTLVGDIKTRTIEIEPGARFSGNCSMLGE